MTESALPAMSGWLHPSLLLMAGALIVPLLRDRSQQVYRVLLALAFAWAVFSIAPGTFGVFRFLGLDIVTGRADTLGRLFACAFALVTVIATVYALHVRDDVQHVAAFFYAAAATGVALAGDLITLYVFWEVMMLASVWLIWRRRTPASYAAGMRYLLVHAAGGMVLLAGIVSGLLPDAAGYSGQCRSAAVTRMADRRLPRSHRDGRHLPQRADHQSGGVHADARLSGH